MSGIAWLLVAEVLFAVMRLATRANADALAWTVLSATRFLGGALVVWGVARLTRASLRIRDRRATWLRALFGTGSSVGVFYSLGSHEISVGDATTLSATAPLFVAALSRPLLGEAVTRRMFVGILVGFLGVVALVGPSFRSSGPVAIVALLGALSYAMAMVYLRRVGQTESPEAVAYHVSLIAGGFALLMTAGWTAAAAGSARPSPLDADLATVGWIALVAAAVAGGLSQIAVTRAYARERAARLGAVSYAGVLLTYALEAAILRRIPSPMQVAGAALVVMAGLLTIGERVKAQEAAAAPDGDG